MKRMIFTVVGALLLSGMALAKDPLLVKPWVYDPDNTGYSQAAWSPKIGLPDNAGKANHGLYLSKMSPLTSDNVASGASVSFSGALTELGFDISNDSHCGAGAPRFNVYTTTGTYFFGCVYGTHTPVPGQPGWTRVRFSAADAFPAGGDFSQVVAIEIVFDEGLDAGNGYAVLDNIDINGTLIGKPGAAK